MGESDRGFYILKITPPPGGGNDFFIREKKIKNEKHKLNPGHHFFSNFPFQELFPPFLHKILKKFRTNS